MTNMEECYVTDLNAIYIDCNTRIINHNALQHGFYVWNGSSVVFVLLCLASLPLQ